MMLVSELSTALLVWIARATACTNRPCNPPFSLAESLFLAGRLKA